MDCQNVVPQKTTNKMLFEIVFRKLSTEVRHIRPFGCCVKFRLLVKEIVRFESRSESVINLFQGRDGIYRIDTEIGATITKHVNFIEKLYSGSTSDSDSDSDSTDTSNTDSKRS